jgi:HAD superfamily hydrolase (TIGR01509 family)
MADVYSWALRATGEEPRDDRVCGLVRMDEELLFEYTCLHEDAVPFLEMHKMKGIASALVSNCAENTRSLLERLGLAGLVDGMVLSCEIGRAKPSPEIYRRALDLLGVEAATTVFVDDQTAYCEGAEAIGITALQISRHGVPEGKSTRGLLPRCWSSTPHSKRGGPAGQHRDVLNRAAGIDQLSARRNW